MSLALPLLLLAAVVPAPAYRTHNDRLTVARYASPAEWQRRAAYLKEHILASSGLLPMPEKTPLRAQVFDERKHDDYSVAKVYFESLPGFFVTGNLYTPAGHGPFPAVLLPHGHWTYGRLENTEISSIPGSAISLARQGFVAFTYDMVGYDDSRQLTHAFGGRRESLWGLSLAGLQLWNGIRSLDFLQSRPDVDPERIGAAGASGGGTQTFLLAAVDERVKVAVPVNMISLHMQGGCLCENPPGLRLDTNNVELAATIAPRPLLMISATGDWTNETPRVEYPEMRKLFALAGAEDRVQTVQIDAPHNYNRPTREALYAWMARWLQKVPADVRVEEKRFQVDRLPDLLVFHGRSLPDGALTALQLTEAWITAARRQWDADAPAMRRALIHALALEPAPPTARARRSRVVVLASEDAALGPALTRAGFGVHPVRFTPFDEDAASKTQHFETYNRTRAAQRVADVAQALRERPGSILVAEGDAGLAGALALAVAPAARAVLGVGQFDTSSDAAYIERLYIPGLRRAGDLQTALAMAKGPILIHDAGARFDVRGPTIEPRKLSASEIVRRLNASAGRLTSAPVHRSADRTRVGIKHLKALRASSPCRPALGVTLVPSRTDGMRPTSARVPAFDPAHGTRVDGEIRGRWPVHLGDERRVIKVDEFLDERSSSHERPCELGVRRLSNDHDEAHLVANDSGELIRLVPDPRVVRDRNPTVASDVAHPMFVGSLGREMIGMALDGEAAGSQDLRELIAEVAVREEDNRQAARSYSTASSIASVVTR